LREKSVAAFKTRGLAPVKTTPAGNA
jgi:hypothetical protein